MPGCDATVEPVLQAALEGARVGRSERLDARVRPDGWTSWAASPTTRGRWCCNGPSANRRAWRCSFSQGSFCASCRGTRTGGVREVEVPLALINAARPPYGEIRAWFAENATRHWAAYVAGVFAVLAGEHDVVFTQGAVVEIESDVPEGKGVSSSAALEAATMTALVAALRDESDQPDEPEEPEEPEQPENPGLTLSARREPRRRRAVRGDGPDGGHLREGGPPDGAAVSACRTACAAAAARRACRVRHRLGHSTRGHRQRLHGRPHRRVHGLSHPRRSRRSCRRPRRARGPGRRATTRAGAVTSPTSAARPSTSTRPTSPTRSADQCS